MLANSNYSYVLGFLMLANSYLNYQMFANSKSLNLSYVLGFLILANSYLNYHMLANSKSVYLMLTIEN